MLITIHDIWIKAEARLNSVSRLISTKLAAERLSRV